MPLRGDAAGAGGRGRAWCPAGQRWWPVPGGRSDARTCCPLCCPSRRQSARNGQQPPGLPLGGGVLSGSNRTHRQRKTDARANFQAGGTDAQFVGGTIRAASALSETHE